LQKIFLEINLQNKGVGFNWLSFDHLAGCRKLGQGAEPGRMGW